MKYANILIALSILACSDKIEYKYIPDLSYLDTVQEQYQKETELLISDMFKNLTNQHSFELQLIKAWSQDIDKQNDDTLRCYISYVLKKQFWLEEIAKRDKSLKRYYDSVIKGITVNKSEYNAINIDSSSSANVYNNIIVYGDSINSEKSFIIENDTSIWEVVISKEGVTQTLIKK